MGRPRRRMIEVSYIVFMALSGILFALGGTFSTDIRRTWLPVCTVVFLLISGVPWWRALPACLFQWWIFSQGYGVRFDWLYRALVCSSSPTPPRWRAKCRGSSSSSAPASSLVSRLSAPSGNREIGRDGV